jgi:hypothetical protein
MRSTYRKIDADTPRQAIVWAIQHGFLTERYDQRPHVADPSTRCQEVGCRRLAVDGRPHALPDRVLVSGEHGDLRPGALSLCALQ